MTLGVYDEDDDIRILIEALERAEQELSYCHAVMGTNRYVARDEALKQIRSALKTDDDDEEET